MTILHLSPTWYVLKRVHHGYTTIIYIVLLYWHVGMMHPADSCILGRLLVYQVPVPGYMIRTGKILALWCLLGIGDYQYEKQVVDFDSSTEYQVYKNDAVKTHNICLLRRTCPMVHGSTVISRNDIIRASYYRCIFHTSDQGRAEKKVRDQLITRTASIMI